MEILTWCRESLMSLTCSIRWGFFLSSKHTVQWDPVTYFTALLYSKLFRMISVLSNNYHFLWKVSEYLMQFLMDNFELIKSEFLDVDVPTRNTFNPSRFLFFSLLHTTCIQYYVLTAYYYKKLSNLVNSVNQHLKIRWGFRIVSTWLKRRLSHDKNNSFIFLSGSFSDRMWFDNLNCL